MVNPFVKFKGIEVFGTYEIMNGRTIAETENRKTTQLAVEGLYRFLKNEQAFIGVKYNTVTSRLQSYTSDVTIDRLSFAAGWFPTKNLLLKGEYVNQNFDGFNGNDIRQNGKFNGVVIQAVVGF